MKAKCKHCGLNKNLAAKGLCPKCYIDPLIGPLYQKVKVSGNTFLVRGAGLTKGREPTYPTAAPAGSRLKMDVMRRRVLRGELAMHPNDSTDDDKMRGIDARLCGEVEE